MKCLNQTTYLFLDYDGTLHESLLIYAPAFRRAYNMLAAQGYAPSQTFTAAQIGAWLGYPALEMWRSLLPQLPINKQKEASQLVGAEMLHLTQQGQAQLYAQTLDVLAQLNAQDIKLIFLSNCSHAYMKAHQQYFQLDRYFTAFYCISDYPVSAKWQMYQQVQANHPGTHIIVGDRFHDLEVAQRFSLPAIGCRYGYGTVEELQPATRIINDITELPDTVQAILITM